MDSRLIEILLVVALVAGVKSQGTNTNQTEAQEFLDMYNAEAQQVFFTNMLLNWVYQSNVTDENRENMVASDLQTDLWSQNMSRRAAQFDTSSFSADMQRQFFKVKDIGTAALEDVAKLEQITDITREFVTSRNEERLRELWLGWRRETGKKIRQRYSQFVSLSNEAVQTLGYEDTGAYWRSSYETPTFEQDVQELFNQLKPLYEQLHAFVRRRLRQQYGDSVFPASGHIPAHLLGNMWAQQWSALQDPLMPYPGKPILDVTEQMVRQGYTPERIFRVADEFFTSLGLEPMPQSFWEGSMLEKPTDGREVFCHPTAWDFYNGVDFRVKQCTEVTMDDFNIAHHEMGHIAYDLLYKDQPIVYRDGANPGFHEAVGDVISLSVETPKHLHKIGLLPTLVEDNEMDLNFLMAMALRKVAFLPFGYLVDQWRWSVFRGETTPDSYNKAWWNLRCGLQGVSPPDERTEDDFDPGAKYHVPNNYQYIMYFVSYVLQFQFHEALCNASGHTGPLHTCDIYNSSAAGEKLRAMLSQGSSKPWTEVFQEMTGTTRMSTQSLLNYFQPLMEFLEHENRDGDVGWEDECPDLSTVNAANYSSMSACVFLAALAVIPLGLNRSFT